MFIFLNHNLPLFLNGTILHPRVGIHTVFRGRCCLRLRFQSGVVEVWGLDKGQRANEDLQDQIENLGWPSQPPPQTSQPTSGGGGGGGGLRKKRQGFANRTSPDQRLHESATLLWLLLFQAVEVEMSDNAWLERAGEGGEKMGGWGGCCSAFFRGNALLT